MSAAFQAQLQADARQIFSGVNDFGEIVVYGDKLGNQFTFTANVFRQQPGPVADTGHMGTPGKPAPRLAVFIPYDPNATATGNTQGIINPPDRGGTEWIETSEVEGGAVQRFPVSEIITSDPGGWLVGLR